MNTLGTSPIDRCRALTVGIVAVLTVVVTTSCSPPPLKLTKAIAPTVAATASAVASPPLASTGLTATATPSANVAVATPSSTPIARTERARAIPTPTAISRATPGTTSQVTPSAAVQKQIQDVIQRANQEQIDAFKKNDPTVMKDTATSAYYDQLVSTNRDLANNGVSEIKLVKLEWGPVILHSASSAEATTFETWQTIYVDGSTDQERDRNVYTLELQGGAWKIQDDAHPDVNLNQPPSVGTPLPQSTQPPSSLTPVPTFPAATDHGQSRNWSGYAASNGTYTAVTGSWTVPEPKTGETYATGATWVGIGGVRSRDLIQAGTDETVLGSGQSHYTAWIEMLPRPVDTVPLAVSPGDSVTVSIAQQKDGQWLISITNNTSGKKYQTTVQYSSSRSSAEWIEEAPSGGRRVLPLEDFGMVRITGASAVKDGKTVSISEAGARPISMVDRFGQVIAVPSVLGADGSSFNVNRLTPVPVATPSRRPSTGGYQFE